MDFLAGIDHRLGIILENLHDSHALIFKEMSGINYCIIFIYFLVMLNELNKNQFSEKKSDSFEIKKEESIYTNEEIKQIIEAAQHLEKENIVYINYVNNLII